MSQELVPVGEIMGAHGVRGELKVKNHNPDSGLLLDLEEVFVQVGTGPAAETPHIRRVLEARPHGKGLLMRLSDCNSREHAQALYGAQLCVPRDALPEPDDDEFYVIDTIGARVQQPNGQDLGVVEGFREYPTTDVLCIRSEDGSLREVPMLAPYFVSFDTERGVMVVDHFFDIEPEPESKR